MTPRAWALLAGTAVLAAAGAGLVLEAGTLEYPAAFAALHVWTALTFMAAGLLWRARRPANRLGHALIALGLLPLVQMLQGVDASVPFTIGVLADVPMFLLVCYAVLAFPSGRLDRVAAPVMAGAVALVSLGYAGWVLTSPEIRGGSPVSACAGSCPENALQVAGGPAEDVFYGLIGATRLVVSLAIAVILIVRLSRASGPARRTLAPVAFLAVVWIVSFWAYSLGVHVMGVAGVAELSLIVWVVIARGLLPVAFLAAPLLAAAFSGVALERMLERLGAGASIARREAVIAEALDDPRLRPAFWLSSGAGYVDREGRAVERPAPGSDLAWTPIGPGDPPGAALVHDPVLCEEPELLAAAGRTLLLALDNDRLHEELERAAAELALSRSELVRSGTVERRQLERKLHDHTQQQLVALRVRLGLAVDRAGGDPALSRLLVQLGSDLEAALVDLRGLAGALYPPVLADEGLPAALAAAARRAGASPSRVRCSGVGRYPDEVEAAVYFALEEALAAAAPSPADADGVWVTLTDGTGVLRFELRREGPMPPRAAERLPGMSAIVGAVGGELRSEVGLRGWVLAGSVPVG